jgi:hypothetical protein
MSGTTSSSSSTVVLVLLQVHVVQVLVQVPW